MEERGHQGESAFDIHQNVCAVITPLLCSSLVVQSQAPEVFINVESHEMVDVDTKGMTAKLSDSASEDAYSISTRPSTRAYPEKARDLSDTNAPDLHVV